MSEVTVENLPVEPFFDLENFLMLCNEARIDGKMFEKLQKVWKEWTPLLNIKNLKQDKNSWVAVWLPEDVEKSVDKAWQDSSKLGYLYHNLAQFICMSVIHELIPQTLDGACAPAPKTSPECTAKLLKEGFLSPENNAPIRRYSILTWYPFKGGCEICTVKSKCPQGNTENNFVSIELPGHEKRD